MNAHYRPHALDMTKGMVYYNDPSWRRVTDPAVYPDELVGTSDYPPTRHESGLNVTAITALALGTHPRRDIHLHCVCAGQGGSVYSAQCPIHDPHVDRDDPHWQRWYDDHNEAQRKVMERLGWK